MSGSGTKSRPLWLGAVAWLVLMSACSAPIPDDQAIRQVPVFIGAPAVPKPLAPKGVTEHPELGEASNFHSDHFNSDVHDFPAPLGIDPVVSSRAYGLCGTPRTNSEGHVITFCASEVDGRYGGLRLVVLHAETLEILAETPIPEGNNSGSEVGGGMYPHVDAQDRVIVGTVDNRFLAFELKRQGDAGFEWVQTTLIQLGETVPEGDYLFDMSPDYQGDTWFVTSHALAGYVSAGSGKISTLRLGADERIENGVAIDEHAVFALTNKALYRLEREAESGSVIQKWRRPYEVDAAPKPGMFSLGSGSTPTLIGEKFIVITDNAAERANLLVYDRRSGDVICKFPLFEKGASAVDVSPIGYDHSVVVSNWYNTPGPLVLPGGREILGVVGDYRGAAPGLTRIDIRKDASGCDRVWHRGDIVSNTVPKLSTATGLIYTWTQNMDISDPVDAWYLTAVDFESGERVFDVLAGTGPFLYSAYLTMTIGPNGSIYQSTLGGIVRIRDRASGADWKRTHQMMMESPEFRKQMTAKSAKYSLDEMREQPIYTTDCVQESLVGAALQLQQGLEPSCDPVGHPERSPLASRSASAP